MTASLQSVKNCKAANDIGPSVLPFMAMSRVSE